MNIDKAEAVKLKASLDKQKEDIANQYRTLEKEKDNNRNITAVLEKEHTLMDEAKKDLEANKERVVNNTKRINGLATKFKEMIKEKHNEDRGERNRGHYPKVDTLHS